MPTSLPDQTAESDGGAPPIRYTYKASLIGSAHQFELTDAGEQARRFAADQQLRETYQRPSLPTDQRLIAALQQGLPECAGVALGVDRLVMLALDAHSIDEVIAFPLGRA